MALAMLDVASSHRDGLGLRIGIDTGPVVAGVIGRRKFIYDLWGDTVNTASRMESHGVRGEIQVTERVVAALADGYMLEPRGSVEIKGKGAMPTWFLRRADDGPASR
jgi:guanylate cyclase